MDDINLYQQEFQAQAITTPCKLSNKLLSLICAQIALILTFIRLNIERKDGKDPSISTKVGPSSYNPVFANTFDSIAKNKDKQKPRWSHGASPAEYNLLNQ